MLASSPGCSQLSMFHVRKWESLCDVMWSKKVGYSELRFDSSYPSAASMKLRRIVLHLYLRLDALTLIHCEEECSELC